MHVVVGGASGFLGSALVARLHSGGHQVTRLVRRPPRELDESRWDPAGGSIDQAVIDSADAVVNLSGAAIARWPWTAAYRQELLDSRVQATHTLATAIASSPNNPTLISGSAMAYYGRDRGAERLPETASPGTGFLSRVVHEWEAAAEPAVRAGSRVCFVRTCQVLHRDGGAFAILWRLFRLGLGGKLASGQQYFPIISRADWVNGVVHLLKHNELSGPFNMVMPEPPTNAEFTAALSKAAHRPAVLPAPGWAIGALTGDLGRYLIGSLRLVPEHLHTSGFQFAHQTVDEVIGAALERSS